MEIASCSSWIKHHILLSLLRRVYQVVPSLRSCPTHVVWEAMASPDADGWKDVMDQEMVDLKSHDVYELVLRMNGMRTLKLGWVFHRTFKNDVFEKNKARLVARGTTNVLVSITGSQFRL